MTPEEIAEELEAQGLEPDVAPVAASFGLFETHPLTPPPDWIYDPNAGPDESVYAPTAAEMEPELAPPDWPHA